MHFLSSPFLLFAALILLLFAGSAVWNVYGTYKEAKRKHDILASSLESLRSRERVLSDDIKRLGTARGVEEELRRRYNAVRAGEEVIVVVGEKREEAPTQEPRWKTWWRRLLALF